MLRLLINMDSSIERLKMISKHLAELGVEFERLSAVDGRKLTEDEVQLITYPLDHFETKVRFTRALTRGEIGCFLSHRECWKRLLNSREQYALILEDDVLISPLSVPYMLSDDWLPQEVGYCQFSCQIPLQKGRINEKKSIKINETLTLVSPISPTPLGTMCYLISRQVAERALALSERLPAPVDNFLFSPWFDLVHEFTLYRVAPTFVVPKPAVESEIGVRAKKDVIKAPFFVRHGLKRMVLDMAVKKYQKQGTPYIFEFKG